MTVVHTNTSPAGIETRFPRVIGPVPFGDASTAGNLLGVVGMT